MNGADPLALAAAACATALGVAALAWVVVQGMTSIARQHGKRLDQLTRVELVELFVFVDPTLFVRLNAALLLLVPAFVLLLSASFVAAGCTFGALLLAPALGYRRFRELRRHQLLVQLPDVAASMASALRAGLALRQAVEQIPQLQPRPIAQEFALVLRQHRLGVPLESGLNALAERAGAHEFRMFAASLAIAADLGGGLAEALDRLSHTVRRRVAMEARIRALTSQGRLQGIVVSLLPFALLAVLSAMQPEAMRPLFTTVGGWAVLTLVLVLELGGWLLIRRIIRINV